MLPQITKSNKDPKTFKEFIEAGNKDNYASEDEWKKSRGFKDEGMNAELSGKFKVNQDGSESWVCKNCGQTLVRDVNGSRAMIRAIGNKNGIIEVYVKFDELAAYCPNLDCKTFNNLAHNTYVTDALADIQNGTQKPTGTLFWQDEVRASEQAQIDKVNKQNIVKDYLLKLK